MKMICGPSNGISYLLLVYVQAITGRSQCYKTTDRNARMKRMKNGTLGLYNNNAHSSDNIALNNRMNRPLIHYSPTISHLRSRSISTSVSGVIEWMKKKILKFLFSSAETVLLPTQLPISG
jgi:hypothetical protein